MASKKVLGRGLGAFFPEYEDEGEGSPKGKEAKQPQKEGEEQEGGDSPYVDPKQRVNIVLHVPVENIRPNPHQPRKEFNEERLDELAHSIKKHGLIQPITVRYIGEKRFELISGERRLRASKLAGTDEIPSYVREVNDEQMIAFALIENIQREELNPLEVAMGYQRLMEECKYTQGEVAERVGKNRSTVTNMMRLLQLPDFLQAALRDEQISTGHARALISVENETDQRSILKKILKKSLSVRQTEKLVRSLSEKDDKADSRKQTKKVSPFLNQIEKRLRDNLSTKVNIKQKGDGGEIRIEYYSNDDLERLLQILDEED